MSAQSKSFTVTILGKEYPIGCPEGEEKQLAAAARYLDEKTRSIRMNSRSVGMDRVLLLAALNIAHELLETKSPQRAAK